MKKFKNLVIGGIENKVFNLILITGLLVAGAFLAIILHQTGMLSQLTAETSRKQQTAITGVTADLMDTVVRDGMERSTELEAEVTDAMFRDIQARVTLMAEFAENMLNNPSGYTAKPYEGPDAAKDGRLVAQMLLADGVDESDPAIQAKLGLVANMSDMLISLCDSFQADNAYIGLPEGAFLSVNRTSGSWFEEDGSVLSYDPRTRFWYKQAAEAGKLIFTDVEVDANTKELSVVCAMPVYSKERELQAVVGADLFITSMQQRVMNNEVAGAFRMVVNQDGHVIFSSRKDGMLETKASAEAVDLRSLDSDLGQLIRDAMLDKTDVRRISLEDGVYYMIGVPIKTIGWTLVTAYSQELSEAPVTMMQDMYGQIEEDAIGTYRSNLNRSKQTIIVLLAIITVLMLTCALILGKRIVKPLNTITRRISELSEGNLEFKMEDAYRTGDEIEVLAESFAMISHKTVQYVDQVKKITAEKERVSVELQLSHDIQTKMLPNIFPAFPDRKEFDIYATMDPAKEVGGDFYDFYLSDENHLVMVIADVSGKGIPAAMFMMASKIIVNNISTMGVEDPARILEAANRQITSNNPAEMFVTMWLGILDLPTGRLVASSAGHEYPYVMHRGGAFEILKDRHGFVLGGLEDSKYRPYELQLEPGDAIFVYTDGVAEANNAKNELFGMDRLTEALNKNPEASCMELLKNVKDAMDEFVQDAPQFDDTTMMAMRYNGLG